MSWTDPDVAKHVSDNDQTISISKFMDNFAIINNNSKATPDNKFYQQKDKGYSTILMKHPSLTKLYDYDILYKNKFNSEQHDNKLLQRPMQKSYIEYNRVELYQLLLCFNSLYSAVDFENNINDDIIFPSNSILTKMFSDILTNNSTHSMTNINHTDDIIDIKNDINNAIDADYDIFQLICDKIYVSVNDLKKLFDLPIIKTYLINNLNNTKNIDNETFNDVMSKMMSLISIYYKQN